MLVNSDWLPGAESIEYGEYDQQDWLVVRFRDGSILNLHDNDLKTWEIPQNWFAINTGER